MGLGAVDERKRRRRRRAYHPGKPLPSRAVSPTVRVPASSNGRLMPHSTAVPTTMAAREAGTMCPTRFILGRPHMTRRVKATSPTMVQVRRSPSPNQALDPAGQSLKKMSSCVQTLKESACPLMRMMAKAFCCVYTCGVVWCAGKKEVGGWLDGWMNR